MAHSSEKGVGVEDKSSDDLTTSAMHILFPPGRVLRELDDILQDMESVTFRTFAQNIYSINEKTARIASRRLVERLDNQTNTPSSKQCNECRALRELLYFEHNFDTDNYMELYGRSITEFEADSLRADNLKTNGWRLAKASAIAGNGWRKYWTDRHRRQMASHLLEVISGAKTASEIHPEPRTKSNLREKSVFVAERNSFTCFPNSDPFSPPLAKKASLRDNLCPILGEDGASFLGNIQSRLVKAISDGDFSAMERMGQEVLHAEFNMQSINAGAHYVIAESLRLRGDQCQHTTEKEQLYRAAIEEYRWAIELNPQSIKSHRGLGRTLEVIGETETANIELNRALAQARVQIYAGATITNEVVHEFMRSSRHLLIHHIGRYRENRGHARARLDLEHRIRGELVDCKNSHSDLSDKFAVDTTWIQIEKFMAWTQIGAVYSSVGDEVTGVCYLALALRERLAIPLVAVDTIFVSNLRWWIELVQQNVKHAIIFLSVVEELKDVLESRELKRIRETCIMVFRAIYRPMQ